MGESTKILAAVGKGGVGKTSLSAAFVRLLAEQNPGKRILAIDADPAVGLATALGITVQLTLDDIRKSIVATVENGKPQEAVELLSEARFRILDALTEGNGFSFIAIGRPESAGCYCKVNAYLKEVITLLAADFDYVVIDGEAGIEQINRRVMEKVTHLILVTDASRKGIAVCDTIRAVADSLVLYDRCGVIVNRLPDGVTAALPEIHAGEVLCCIPSDPQQAANDMRGDSVFCLPTTSPLLQGAKTALIKLKLL